MTHILNSCDNCTKIEEMREINNGFSLRNHAMLEKAKRFARELWLGNILKDNTKRNTEQYFEKEWNKVVCGKNNIKKSLYSIIVAMFCVSANALEAPTVWEMSTINRSGSAADYSQAIYQLAMDNAYQMIEARKEISELKQIVAELSKKLDGKKCVDF